MQCIQFEQMIEEQSEGPLAASAALHLEECSDCRLLWEDLGAIRAAGVSWGLEQPVPSDRVWTAIRAQLESEGIIRGIPAPVLGSQTNWLGRWFGSAPRVAMAGAYLSVLLLAAALAGVRGNPSTSHPFTRVAPGAPVASVADLSQTLDTDMKRVMASLPQHNPSLTDSLQHNLGIVDNMIAVCEKSVREQPYDPVAREYLYGAYQQKAVLLATAMDRGALEDR